MCYFRRVFGRSYCIFLACSGDNSSIVCEFLKDVSLKEKMIVRNLENEDREFDDKEKVRMLLWATWEHQTSPGSEQRASLHWSCFLYYKWCISVIPTRESTHNYAAFDLDIVTFGNPTWAMTRKSIWVVACHLNQHLPLGTDRQCLRVTVWPR